MGSNPVAPHRFAAAWRHIERLALRPTLGWGRRPATALEPGQVDVTTLERLAVGQAGRVLRVGGRPAVRRRLLELGIVRGETMTLERTAPLGDPLEFLVKGYHLSLRAREAAAISIEVVGAPGIPEIAERPRSTR